MVEPVDVQDALAANRANWDDRADVHARSQMYDVAGFLADPTEISWVVRNDLEVLAPHLGETGVKDRSLLHLQCHIGTDTISWARLGARDVHGIDLSPNSLRHAARIAEADGRDITWVEGDVRFASSVIRRRFDTLVTSTGTIVWLPELANWARSIHDLLEPGGVFMIRDDHPILSAMDYEPWDIVDDYLSGGESASTTTRGRTPRTRPARSPMCVTTSGATTCPKWSPRSCGPGSSSRPWPNCPTWTGGHSRRWCRATRAGHCRPGRRGSR